MTIEVTFSLSLMQVHAVRVTPRDPLQLMNQQLQIHAMKFLISWDRYCFCMVGLIFHDTIADTL